MPLSHKTLRVLQQMRGQFAQQQQGPEEYPPEPPPPQAYLPPPPSPQAHPRQAWPSQSGRPPAYIPPGADPAPKPPAYVLRSLSKRLGVKLGEQAAAVSSLAEETSALELRMQGYDAQIKELARSLSEFFVHLKQLGANDAALEGRLAQLEQIIAKAMSEEPPPAA